jgi:hypothetical protein
MELDRLLQGPHERRLAEVRQLAPAARPPPMSSAAAEPEEAEERLRVAMVQLLPRAGQSDEACVRLLSELAHLWSSATADVRALDAWHNAYEEAVERRLDPETPEFRSFLVQYAALLESWVGAGS